MRTWNDYLFKYIAYIKMNLIFTCSTYISNPKGGTKMIRMPIQQMIPYHHQYPRNTATTAPKKENENTQGLSFHEILQQKMAQKNASPSMR